MICVGRRNPSAILMRPIGRSLCRVLPWPTFQPTTVPVASARYYSRALS
jgi:hypothetical protein